ncbi:hypothetical protein V7S57_13360 [Caulobacter sp. CCNWLY153]|uniref:capsular polysaccharide export protein, LipB/KpsS family n=1 Tax=unclassified Caulobacter TaxID=2648921 RepID=UPI002FEF566A
MSLGYDRRIAPRPALPVLRAPAFGRRRPIVSRLHDFDHALDRCATASGAERKRAAALAQRLAEERMGGAFWAPPAKLPPRAALLRPRTPAEVHAMLSAALAETLAGSIVVSAPDLAWARALRATVEAVGAALLVGEAEPWSLVEDAAWVTAHAGDPLAFHAIGAGTPVRWTQPRDLSGLPPDALAHAYLLDGASYRDPFSGLPSDAETTLALLLDWRRHLSRTRDVTACFGVAPWKRRSVADLLASPERSPIITHGRRSVALAHARGGVAVGWATRLPHGVAAEAAQAGVALARMEDGFLRSAGLGSGLTPPLSLTLDRLGLHYDPAGPSELSELLASSALDEPALLTRAERLIANLRTTALCKYGLDRSRPYERPQGERVILVVGQVEDDASVRLGGREIQGNLELLARARAAEPGAVILYRPHPDVEAGHRRGAVADRKALLHADRVVRETGTLALTRAVDAVHVLTSLAGFEALLHEKEVVTHGSPFYAGWGLTTDLATPRRGALSLAQMAAAALILYPLYLDPRTRLPCPPEVLIERLIHAPPPPSILARARGLQGRLVKAMGPLQ